MALQDVTPKPMRSNNNVNMYLAHTPGSMFVKRNHQQLDLDLSVSRHHAHVTLTLLSAGVNLNCCNLPQLSPNMVPKSGSLKILLLALSRVIYFFSCLHTQNETWAFPGPRARWHSSWNT